MATTTIHVRALRADDRERWSELWQGYLDFYRYALPADVTDLTWRRLLDPAHPFQGLAALGRQSASSASSTFTSTHRPGRASATATSKTCSSIRLAGARASAGP